MEKSDQQLVNAIIQNLKDGINCPKEYVGEVLMRCSEMELNGVIPTICKATKLKPAQLRDCMKLAVVNRADMTCDDDLADRRFDLAGTSGQ